MDEWYPLFSTPLIQSSSSTLRKLVLHVTPTLRYHVVSRNFREDGFHLCPEASSSLFQSLPSIEYLEIRVPWICTDFFKKPFSPPKHQRGGTFVVIVQPGSSQPIACPSKGWFYRFNSIGAVNGIMDAARGCFADLHGWDVQIRLTADILTQFQAHDGPQIYTIAVPVHDDAKMLKLYVARKHVVSEGRSKWVQETYETPMETFRSLTRRDHRMQLLRWLAYPAWSRSGGWNTTLGEDMGVPRTAIFEDDPYFILPDSDVDGSTGLAT
ncbi:hypothetical protein CC2G_005171 [Coprinopsis cinerea AmutBmut pab1-1]|nr:hypothetical protein CC2G_005171 [Coprinopsis cinerea AmutBmut pab1-1]